MSLNADQRRLTVLDDIEYETLISQAEELLTKYVGEESWTDRLDSDPGTTLLQAIIWNVFDLSWRHTHPLRDLLTPAPEEQTGRNGIFGEAFGPQRALTHSPVTADDYRRALLDLHGSDIDEERLPNSFLLRDVLMVNEAKEDRYHYWYDGDNYTFTFHEPKNQGETAAATTEHDLLGGYSLWLIPERDVSTDLVEPVVREFLLNHRNLGERVRALRWLQPQQVDLEIELELDDDCDDPARVLADLFTLCERFLNPSQKRSLVRELLDQGMEGSDVWNGPELKHGWIRW